MTPVIEFEAGSSVQCEAAEVIRDALRGRPEADIRFFIGEVALAKIGGRLGAEAIASEDAYAVVQTAVGPAAEVCIAGRGKGVLYGAYAWLERQGWSFHVHGDIEPDNTQPIHLGAFELMRQPRFRWRGLQLWNYWWPGRDSWCFEDFKAYLNQFQKLGLNHFEFPLYWYEPLFTGVSFAGAPMRRLRLSGADVELASVGRGALAGLGRFTSKDIPNDAPDDERFQAARNLMRRVFAHAKSLNLRITAGVELANVSLVDPSLLSRLPPEHLYERGLLIQPSSPTGLALSRARLSALFDAFPDLDVYAIWQNEMGPARTTSGSPHPVDVAFRAQHAGFSDRLEPGDFDQLQWLRNAAQIAAEIKPGAQLATGGWGAERLMHAADATLPDGFIMATIADYEPGFGLRRGAFGAYSATKKERSHTTWAEVDQHLWILQTKIATTAKVLDELASRGVESASQLHWRLLFPDADLWSFAKGCWQGTGSPAALRHEWARQKFGEAAAESVADGLAALEAYNSEIVARSPDIHHSAWWVGFDCFMSGLLSANRYLDGGLTPKYLSDNVTPLLDAAATLDGHLAHAAHSFAAATAHDVTPAQRNRLEFWANRTQYSLNLHRAHVAIARAAASAASGDFHLALEHVQAARAEDVVAGFSERLGEGAQPDRGELGLLLTLNVKFLGSAKRIEQALKRQIAGNPKEMPLGSLDVRAGAFLPARVYQTFFELLHVAAEPWRRDVDFVAAEEGFSYDIVQGRCGRLSPSEGVWSDPEKVIVALTAPAGWCGSIDLYFYQEPDWDTPFRVQDIEVDGVLMETMQDFYGRGENCDEGVWRSYPVSISAAGPIRIAVTRRGGGDARLSRIVLRS